MDKWKYDNDKYSQHKYLHLAPGERRILSMIKGICRAWADIYLFETFSPSNSIDTCYQMITFISGDNDICLTPYCIKAGK